jgi:hypothetical protein
VPLQRGEEDKLSISEVQLEVGNQAAVTRMKMVGEYDLLRQFQNSEVEVLIRGKMAKDVEFAKLVEETKRYGRPPMRRPSRLIDTARPPTSPGITQSPMMTQHISPGTMSPQETLPAFLAMQNDPQLPPSVKFFLRLGVVQQNWPAISRGWPQYVSLLSRRLMTEHAFVKAILEDAVRVPGKTFPVDKDLVERTRQQAREINEENHISKVTFDVVLEMADQGDIEFIASEGDSMGEVILMEVVALEKAMLEQPETKATDPRLNNN